MLEGGVASKPSLAGLPRARIEHHGNVSVICTHLSVWPTVSSGNSSWHRTIPAERMRFACFSTTPGVVLPIGAWYDDRMLSLPRSIPRNRGHTQQPGNTVDGFNPDSSGL